MIKGLKENFDNAEYDIQGCLVISSTSKFSRIQQLYEHTEGSLEVPPTFVDNLLHYFRGFHSHERPLQAANLHFSGDLELEIRRIGE